MFDEMFADIGKKIKKMAICIFILEAGSSILGGLIYMFSGEDLGFLFGMLIIVVGVIVAYVSSWFLYGFGEIIDKLTDIEYNTRCKSNASEDKTLENFINKFKPQSTQDSQKTQNSTATHKWRCPGCGKMISSYPCVFCGHSDNNQ